MPEEQQKLKTEISWQAPEFVFYEKGADWFFGLFLIAGILFLVSLFTKSYIFSLIIVLAVFSIWAQAQRRPKKIDFSISEKGVATGSEIHAWRDLNSFWIVENEEIKYISFESKKILRPRLGVPLNSQDAEQARKILKLYLPEKKHEESGLDILARRLRY